MAAEALREVENLNEKLKDQPFKLSVVPVESLEFLDKNARYMTNEMFNNLVNNIQRDQGLSSVLFCRKIGDKYRVLSGNHRGQAAITAGLTEVLVMYTDKDLTQQEEIAIQLSHNSIAGQDDQVILKQLWEEIKDVNLKFYAGLDDKTLDMLSKISLEPLSEVNLDFRTATFVFLPDELERLEQVFQDALSMISAKNEVYVARLQEFDRMIKNMDKTKGAYSVKNSATALMLILDVFERHPLDIAEGWEDKEDAKRAFWVPLSSVFGTDTVPLGVAKTLQRAVQVMVGKGEVTKNNLWQSLEYMAAEYLGGA